MKEGITKEELLDVAQWLEDAAVIIQECGEDSAEDLKQVMTYMQRAEFVRCKVAEME